MPGFQPKELPSIGAMRVGSIREAANTQQGLTVSLTQGGWWEVYDSVNQDTPVFRARNSDTIDRWLGRRLVLNADGTLATL